MAKSLLEPATDQGFETVLKESYDIPILARGKVIEPNDTSTLHFGGRYGAAFLCPDPSQHIRDIALENPSELKDLADTPVDEIIDYLVDLGRRLVLKDNEYLQDAFILAIEASGLTTPVLRGTYDLLPHLFERETLDDVVEKRIGKDYLDGWVEQENNGDTKFQLRAFGARTLHIVAGNVPALAAVTVIRAALTKSDAIIKLPSNDPLTASAIVRTMFEMDPNHPVSKHFAVAYWKGGEKSFEELLYAPYLIDKIIAWGGLASVRHVTQYVQPGIDLITLDPKLSISVIGKEALADPGAMNITAQRAAVDVGAFNQEACLCSRVVYVESGTSPEELEKLNKFGELIHGSLINLPENISTPPKSVNFELKEKIDGLSWLDDCYKVFGDPSEGVVIVSQIDEAVDFSDLLCGRVANIVPLEDINLVPKLVNAYTQTVGIYPESLKDKLADDLVLHGVQRIVSLGGATQAILATPQDGIEPMRRSVTWVANEISV